MIRIMDKELFIIKKIKGFFLSDEYHGIGIEYFLSGKKKRKMKYQKGKALSKCLYEENDKEVYIGYLMNGKLEYAKDITIYRNL